MAPAAGTWDATHLRELADAIEVGTSGRLKIATFLAGEHPYGMTDMLQAVSSGETDVGGISGGYSSALEPRLGILDMPFLLPGGDVEIYLEVYDFVSKGFFRKVWDDWNIEMLMPLHWSGQQFYLKEGWLEDWDSFKGKDIRVWSKETASLVTLLGGNPVSISFGEVYTALQTGLIDGLISGIHGCYVNGFLHECRNVVIISCQYATCPYMVNKDSLAALPTDVREDLFKVIEAQKDYFETGLIRQDGMALLSAFLTEGITARSISSTFREEIRAASYEGIWKPWIDRAGQQGAEAFGEVAKLLIDMGYEVPGYNPRGQD